MTDAWSLANSYKDNWMLQRPVRSSERTKLTRDQVQQYLKAVEDLAKEGNERAQAIKNYLDNEPDIEPWAWNIHNNVWGIESFASLIKARMLADAIRRRSGIE